MYVEPMNRIIFTPIHVSGLFVIWGCFIVYGYGRVSVKGIMLNSPIEKIGGSSYMHN